MDKNMKYVVLVAVGGVGVYLLYKGNYLQQWFPSLFASGGIFAGGATPATTAGQSAACTVLAQKVGGVSKVMANDPLLPKIRGIVTVSADQEAMLTACGGLDLTADQLSVIQKQITGPPPIASTPTTPTPHTNPSGCPPGQVRVNSQDPTSACIDPRAQLPNYCDQNTPGWSYQNGQCLATPPAVQTISDKMVAAAGMSDGLDMDQWAYYFEQITGQPSPRDPGDIIAAAGPNPPSFPDGRNTVMDIGTWLAFMNQDGAGISGLEGLAALHVANAWLV